MRLRAAPKNRGGPAVPLFLEGYFFSKSAAFTPAACSTWRKGS